MTSRAAAFASAACLVSLPVLLLADAVDRPAWMWTALAAFGTVALYRVMSHMQQVIEYDRELHPEDKPKPLPSLRESVDNGLLRFMEATGLIGPVKRLADWLARHLPGANK